MNSSGNNFPHTNGTNGQKMPSGYNGRKHDSDDEIDLLKLFSTLLRNKWILIAFVGTFSVLAAILAINQVPIYRSEGTIFISESKNRYSYAGSDLSNLLTTTYGIGVGSTIANELQILKSRTLSEYLADSLLAAKFTKSGHKFPLLWRAYGIDSTTVSADTVAMRIRSILTAEQVDRETDVVRIGFESPSPEEAAYLVNLTMDTYSQLSTEQNRSMASSALNFLRGERDKFENQLTRTEIELRDFMDKTSLISVDPQTEQLISTISSLETKKQEIEVQLVAVNSAIDAYSSQLEQIKPGLANQFSASLAQILERYQFELAELDIERFLLISNNPGIEKRDVPELVTLDNQIELVRNKIKEMANEMVGADSELALSFLSNENGSVTQRIIETSQKLLELRVQQSQFDTQISSLDNRISELNTQFNQLPEEIIKLARLKREVKVNEALYLLVRNQFSEMSLWENTQFGMGRPLDYAVVPHKPIKPQKKLWVLIGFLLGGILGTGFIFIKETVDDSIKSSEDLSEFSLPFLGNIPDFKMGQIDPNGKQVIEGKTISNQLFTFIDHISPISEAYRRLRINTVYSNPDRDYKVLMVTSSTKGEGKSTVAANLAVTFAEAEKSVLIVDLDLRRPTLHKVFGEAKEPGLVELLFGAEDYDTTIKQTIAPNVDLISVGKKTPEPASVLDSKRLKSIIDKLKDQYDHIILDTAPYGIISDSASLLRLTDGLIVVSRFNTTTKRELQYTIDGLRHLNAEIIGLVLNAFNPKKSSDYYSNYHYYKRTYSDYYKEEV